MRFQAHLEESQKLSPFGFVGLSAHWEFSLELEVYSLLKVTTSQILTIQGL